jgi:hypothetical protein
MEVDKALANSAARSCSRECARVSGVREFLYAAWKKYFPEYLCKALILLKFPILVGRQLPEKNVQPGPTRSAWRSAFSPKVLPTP